MRTLAIALVLAIWGVSHCEARTFHSYAFSKQYDVSVTTEALERSPQWKTGNENPPLSAMKAIALAAGLKESLVKDDEDSKWYLMSANLTPAAVEGKWFWLVEYEAVFQKGGSSGPRDNLRLVVLMDGTVIKPVVKDYPAKPPGVKETAQP